LCSLKGKYVNRKKDKELVKHFSPINFCYSVAYLIQRINWYTDTKTML
jgi:hypothetical protein